MMDRRRFLLTSLAGALAAPFTAEAQQPPPKTGRLGYLSLRSGPERVDEAFRQGLRERGYVEGQKISVEYRWADWKPDRLPALAAELVRLNVDVIVATPGNIPALAVKKVTRTIPIVFTSGADPVTAGLVASLDRPGGNITGVNLFTVELSAKRLHLLKEAIPGVSRVAVLANRASPWKVTTLKEVEGAAQAVKVKLQALEVRDSREIDEAFAAMTRERAGALLVLSDPMLFSQRDQIVHLAAKRGLPGIFE
jgi:putative ABC transport system substrate-binding protein